MKYLILLFIILNFSKSVWSQTNSENGFWQPCHGQLRVLLIYAEMVNDPNYNIVTQTGWPEGQMPTNPGKYFDINYSNNLTGYITKYFNEASFGEYQVLGDYYPQLIQIDYNNSTSANFFSKVINALHQTIGTDLTTANNLSINNQDFDKWSNYNLGVQKLEIPDYKIDMIVVLWRVNSYITGIQNPTSNQGSINLTQLNISLKNSVGLNCSSNFVSFDNNADVIMRHELSHALYGYNNFHTAGAGAGTRTFISSVGGWSNMSSWDSNSQGWNAWDRWRLGWKNPIKQYLISGYNSQNNAETDFENYSLSNNPNGGEYVLQDFNSTGDAIRIKLPIVDNNALPQYLWIENHSLAQSEFDFNYNRRGIYAFVQVGKEDKSNVYSSESSSPGNYLFPLPASGRFDFKYDIPNTLIDLDNSVPNPLTGYHLLMRQGINGLDNEQEKINPTELFLANKIKLNDQTINHYPTFGNDNDAFRLNTCKKISISTNPSSQVLQTYITSNFPNYPDNDTIHLSGLSIEIIEENHLPSVYGSGATKLKIRWDDYEVKNNVRWCGDIMLYPSVHFSAANLPLDAANEISLLLKTGNTLWLDRGKCPTQHVSYEQISGEHFFTQPSRFTATVNSYILQEYNSTIHVDNKSTLLLEAGSKLEMNSGSQLLVTNGSTLIIENDAELLMHDAYIYIDETSTLIIRNLNPNAGLCLGQVQNVPSNALMEVKGTIRYENGAPMNYKGSGKLVFIGTAAKIEFEDAINSTVEFIAPDLLFPALELREEANITLNANSMMIGNMIIEVHDNSTLKFEDAEYVMLQDIHVNGYSVTDATNTAMEITDVQSIEIGSLRFNQDANAAMQGALKITGIPATSIISMYDVRIDRAIHPLAISGGDYFKCSQLFINLTGDPGSDVLVTLKKLNKSIIKTSVLKYGNTGISISGSSTFLQNILYLDGTELGYMETGIDAKGAQLFLRNGSGITSTAIGIKAEGNVIYDDQNNPITFNSMITLGDVGCANILQFRNYGILATNTLLNMDANLHAIANQSDPIPNSMVRASSNSGTFIKICYTNKNPNASIIPTTIYASGNYWGGITPIAPGGSQSPDFDVKKYGNYACVGFNQNIIPVETAPLTNCEVLLNDCESCESVTNENEGAAQNMLIGNAYKMLYGAFTPIDTTYTRNPFEEISILRMELDTMNNIWTVYDIEDSAYVVSEHSVHRILVSRVLRPMGTSSNERKGIRDIFESIKENPKESLFSFKLYPNPAGQHIQLTSNYSGLIFCSLYDIQGRLMSYYVFQQQHNLQAINIEALTDGIYCLRITDAQHKLLDKITFIKSN